MKNKITWLIVGMFLISNIQLKSQNYIPMALDSARWIVKLDYMETPIPVDGLWEYYANGDTLVEGTFYMKIYKRNLEVSQTGPPFTPISEYELTALMRDDIAEKKVYVIPVAENVYSSCDLGVESLLYDFSLNVGDTVALCVLPDIYGEPYFISSIDEALMYGMNTRLFFVDVFLGCYCEGIGSDYGLLEDMFIPVKNANYNLYGTSLAYYCRKIPCGLIVGTNDKPLPSDFSVYPNPANREIYIQLPTNTPPSVTKIEVYSAEGRLIHKAIPANNPYVLNAESLVSGLYLIRMWDGKVWQSGKVIRE